MQLVSVFLCLRVEGHKIAPRRRTSKSGTWDRTSNRTFSISVFHEIEIFFFLRQTKRHFLFEKTFSRLTLT